MPISRRFGVPSALVCLFLLAGCSKPTPAVTVQSGPVSVRSEALQFLHDGKDVGTHRGPKALAVRPGQHVNISVDRTTARAGWAVVLAGQKVSPVLTGDKHTYAFQDPGFGTDVPLVVYQLPPNGGDPVGAWLFTLREVA